MSKYVDADELLKEAYKDGAYGYVSSQEIKDFPASDVVKVRHGRWIDAEPAPFGQMYETCSECGTRQTLDKGKDRFCGVCGAKMDEVEECQQETK